MNKEKIPWEINYPEIVETHECVSKFLYVLLVTEYAKYNLSPEISLYNEYIEKKVQEPNEKFKTEYVLKDTWLNFKIVTKYKEGLISISKKR